MQEKKMVVKNKHNKKRNTAFLYEIVVRAITKSILEKNSEVSEGVLDFEELIVYGETEKPISPCGACRQVMAEFFDEDLKVTLVAKDKSTVVMTVKELLPYSFTDLT